MRSFNLAFAILALLISKAVAGYLPLLQAGLNGGGGVTNYVLQTDGVSRILLVDGTSKLLKAQP